MLSFDTARCCNLGFRDNGLRVYCPDVYYRRLASIRTKVYPTLVKLIYRCATATHTD